MTEERIFDLKHHYTDIFGSRIHFVTYGDNRLPSLFLIHSFYLSWSVYKRYIESLSKKFYLIIPDLPGFGESEGLSLVNSSYHFADVIEEIRKFLKLDRVFLFGFSGGGIVSIKYAALYPRSAGKVSVQGSPYYFRDYKIIKRDRLLLFLSAMPPFTFLLKFFASIRFVWRVLRVIYRNLSVTMSNLGDDAVRENFISISPRAAREWAFDIINVDIREDLRIIRCPLQIITGDNDPYITLESVYRMSKFAKDYTITIIADADHEITIKKPALVSEEIIKFFTK